MLLQLKHIYKTLYKDGFNGRPFFQTNWTVKQFDHPAQAGTYQAMQEKLFEYFTHPSTFRWAIPALSGKVKFHIESPREKQIVFFRQDGLPPVKNQIDFLKRHFQPVYEEIKIEFELRNKDKNLQDLMGKDSGKFNASGSAIRRKMMDSFRDPKMIRQMVITQQIVLEQYEYRACDFRSCIIGFIDSAMTQNPMDISLIENGLLQQLRIVLLNLLSKGNDAAALACLLLSAALREDVTLILFQFMGADYDIFSLEESTEPGQIEMGNDLYLTYKQMTNFMGGYRKTDITLWKHPATMLEKITDIFGYFFYPVEIIEAEGFVHDYRIHGPQINYPCNISPFENNNALFEWMYQPDGWYFADSWGLSREDQEEIILYAYMDKNGRIITPFSEVKPGKPNDCQQE